MTIPSRFPLDSFDPRFKRILLEGAIKERVFTFSDEKKAARFQARLQLYRAQVRKQQPDEAARLYRARTSRKGKIVRVYPADLDFEEALSTVSPAPAAPTEDILPPATPHVDPKTVQEVPMTMDELFADLAPYEEPKDDI
jgi:hypothetical protein